MLELKEYQKRALDRLREYLTLAGETTAKRAFLELTDEQYHGVPDLPELPYVCLRVPTGGGKTLMACHAVGLATRLLLQAERSVVLWLVPTDQIRRQTLDALRDRSHPYRQSLEESLGTTAVTVLDLSEALSVQRSTLDADTCVVVSTLAALRVENTEGRRIYETAGALMSHFQGLTDEQRARLELEPGGAIAYSLANVLRLRRPVVIMDEAHNARTTLSFTTLARFDPACVVEFTATPERRYDPGKEHFASNVLCHVSAAELKTEAMVKLPIYLQTQADWQEALAQAVRQRNTLEELARAERSDTGEYLRPIMLLQAQPHSAERETVTAEVVEKCLVDELHIPAEQVRVATGERREIAGEDLSSADCPVRFIITVQALSEGWDCPFAYVLCSVSEVGTPKAVEQILGRIMRLPGARRKTHEPLNAAYAFVASHRFFEAAEGLRDGLVANGYEKLEAARMVEPAEGALIEAGLAGTLFARPTTAQEPAPSERDVPFAVPQLARRVGRQLELWEPEEFLPADWEVSDCDAALSEAEFPTERPAGEAGAIDVTDSGRFVARRFPEQVRRDVALLAHEDGWPAEHLANWLDRNIPHQDIPKPSSSRFLLRLVQHLIGERGLSLALLTSERFRLCEAAAAKIDRHRREARKHGFDAQLQLDRIEQIEVGPEVCFPYDKTGYSPNVTYPHAGRYRSHYYPLIGEMNDEEAQCASMIDSLPHVKHWVRNLSRRPRHSFWLPTTTDLFYPDFVAELTDGGYLIVEYKGEGWIASDDTREKEDLGRLWQDRSNGLCRFLLVGKEDVHRLPQLVGQ